MKKIINFSFEKIIQFFILSLCFFSFPVKSEFFEIRSNWKDVSNETKSICISVENLPKYLEDFISKDQHKSHLNCDASSLYYGFENISDYNKARECALSTRNYEVLTMLFANGRGVEKNIDIALHFACMIDGAPSENDLRIKHLIMLKEKSSNKIFDICDDITSGNMMSYCASLAQKFLKINNKKK